MANYSASHQTPAGTNLTMIHIGGAAAARPKLSYLALGSPAAPVNLMGDFRVLKSTVAPTGGSGLPEVLLGSGEVITAGCTALGGTMVEPTYTDPFLFLSANQQAFLQNWWNEGFEPTTPVGTANGIGLRCIAHGGTPNVNATVYWRE